MNNKLLVLLFVMSSIFKGQTIYAFNAHNMQRYFWANYHQYAGNLQKSHAWYKKIFGNHSSIYTYKGYIKFLFQTGNSAQIVPLMSKLKDKFENDPDIQLIFAQSLKQTNHTKEADELLIKLNRKFKSHAEITFHVVEAFSNRKELENALGAIDNFLNSSPRKPNNFIFYFLKAQIYSQLSNYPAALENIKECLQMHNQFDKAWLLMAILEENAGKLNEAIKGYTGYLEYSQQANQEIEQHLLELALRQKGMEQNTKVLLLNKSCFEKCLILVERKQYEQALKQIDHCLQEEPDNVDSKLLKIQILSTMHKFDQACTLLSQWIAKEPDNALWYKTLHLMAHADPPMHKVIKTLEALHKQQPKNNKPVLYLADLCTRAQLIQKAIAYHTKACQLTTDKQLKTRILFHLSLVYYEQKQFDNMQATLEEGYKLSTDFPPLLNLLAYFYATRGKKLDEAKKLIKTVLKADPHNPHFLDTKATILYKKGNYTKAHDLLATLIQQEPHDAMILIHLAKVEYTLGNKSQALKRLQAAQQATKNSHEQATIEKLLKRWSTSHT